ncbi:hypothetical protein C5E07_16010 [Pseudoclavibacter sp. RFBJ3]|uniref:beta-ketoacyl synthase N-terminal-like domain-containing protein n=1 Tax=unclassified Pseudoclavibacter TaxID=2615177 RepID=UPI000CE7CBD5|nr:MULTISPECIES: beta-ketoacyl synthase N-terminal-like domain-containing protein [unclassified Pseudoclavibacter]PPF81737.1 hypothetical protein C5C12_15755 [Pseudoclavibacter sp. RFBJ5]PPF91067.1 hypothetical protein C5E07_16010 [Pseudoclavibacter sp. RFBJ3]PPG00343.1 hypothetical protein C5C19_03920 [Pseudoclavibacter sp. RFBH5]PPG19358.1 hypothetical protein C5E13_16880 [Pseudoclavibacter sp. RFBI4]
MTAPTLITGFGAISPLGLRLEDHAASAGALDRFGWAFADIDEAERLASRSTTQHGHETRPIPEGFSITDYVKPVGLRRKKRFSQIAMAAATVAFTSARLGERPADLERVGVVTGTEYGPQRVVSEYLNGLLGGGLQQASPGLFTQTVYNVANGQASLALGLKGANSTLVGGSALAYAELLLASGKADALLAISLDETNQIMTEYFDRVFEHPRGVAFTFATGEAAAVVVLESARSAEARGATPLATLLSTASASAAGAGVSYLDWQPDDTTIEHSMRQALERANLTIDEVDTVVGTANGLEGLTRSELSAIRAIGHRGSVLLPRLATGECFGGNEALAHVIGLQASAPGSSILTTVATVNGGVTSTITRKAAA